MKPADNNIEKQIKNLRTNASAELDEKLHRRFQQALDKEKTTSAKSEPIQWRTIMHSKITKLAVAAIVIIALGVGVNLIEKATTPAWAIEQSIEAMKNYRGLCFSGMLSVSWKELFKNFGIEDLPELPDSEGEFEMWARADENLSRSAETKIICPGVIVLGKKLQNYVQFDDGSTYNVHGQHMKIDPWPTTELLKILKEKTGTWTEMQGRDADTGKERIFVSASRPQDNRSWQLEFDAQSKLLVSLKQWDNSSKHEGVPTIDIWKIVYYEQLPNEIFKIDLPDPNKIIAVNTPPQDPNYGMSTEGLTEEQACHKILEEFWQAAVEGHYDTVRKLMPYLANHSDEQLDSDLGRNDGLAGLVEMGPLQQGEIGPIIPCTLQFKNGKMIVDIIVLFRDIESQKSCVIHSNKGDARPVE